jgi:hypothetical protein
MVSPNVRANISQPFAVLAGAIILSYFSHVGWWALAGLMFLIGSYFSGFGLVIPRIFLIISCIFFVLALVAMKWVWL